MHFLSNFACKIIFMCSVNFWQQQDYNSLFNPLMPKPARLSLCLMPDDFTRQWGTPRSQWVKVVFYYYENVLQRHSTVRS